MITEKKPLNNKPFNITKTITVFICPILEKIKMSKLVNINILEAVIEAFNDNQYTNASKGILLILMLNRIEKQKNKNKIILFKLWIIFYYEWNMEFCKNQGYAFKTSFAHNFPALIFTLFSRLKKFNSILEYWGIIRLSSLFITVIDLIIKNGFIWEGIELDGYKLFLLNMIICYWARLNKYRIVKGCISTSLINLF